MQGDRGGCTQGDKGDEGQVKSRPFVHQGGIHTSLHTSTWMRVEVQAEGRCREDRGGCTRGDKGDGGMVKAGQFVHRGGIYWTVHTFIVKRMEKLNEGGMKKEEVQ